MKTSSKSKQAQATTLRPIDFQRLNMFSPVTIVLFGLTSTAITETVGMITGLKAFTYATGGFLIVTALLLVLHRNALSAVVLADRIGQSATLVDCAMREAIRTGRKAHAGEGWWVSVANPEHGSAVARADRAPEHGVSHALFGLSTQGRLGQVSVLSLLAGVVLSLAQLPSDSGLIAWNLPLTIIAYASNGLLVAGTGLFAYGVTRSTSKSTRGRLVRGELRIARPVSLPVRRPVGEKPKSERVLLSS